MLLRRIETFMRATRMPPATFGRRAVGDSNFVFDLKNGREPRPRLVRKVDAFIAAYPGEPL
jgi:hypothetical protein